METMRANTSRRRYLIISGVVILLIVLLTSERDAGNAPMLVNSLGLLVLSVMAWRSVPWSRPLLFAFLVWRVAQIGVSVSSRFGPGDPRIGGTMILVTLYVVAGLLVGSPLGRLETHAAT